MNNFDILKYIQQEFIENKIINKNDLLLIALSGGKDSMCLLWAIMQLNKNNHLNIKAIHINHQLRDKESDRDEEFVKKYCVDNNIDIIIKKIDCISYSKQNRISIEESARILRYKSINDIQKKYKNEYENVYVLLAHHKKDQVETIIHNMLRGSGISGIIGMKEINDNLIRPFLYIDKNIINDIIEYNNIPYVEDSTNNDDKYTRNYIRNNILNAFENINSNYQNHIIDLSNDIKEIDEYFYKISNEYYNQIIKNINNEIIIDCKLFKSYNHIIQIYLVRLIFDNNNLPKKDITRKHIDDIINIITGNNNRHLDLPYKLTIDKKNNFATLKYNNEVLSMKNKKRGGYGQK